MNGTQHLGTCKSFFCLFSLPHMKLPSPSFHGHLGLDPCTITPYPAGDASPTALKTAADRQRVGVVDQCCLNSTYK